MLVLAGKDKGVKAEVLEVLVEKQRAIVKGVNIITKHAKPSAKNPQGGIVKTEAPIHISNLMVVNPETGKVVSSCVFSRTPLRLRTTNEQYSKS